MITLVPPIRVQFGHALLPFFRMISTPPLRWQAWPPCGQSEGARLLASGTTRVAFGGSRNPAVVRQAKIHQRMADRCAFKLPLPRPRGRGYGRGSGSIVAQRSIAGLAAKIFQDHQPRKLVVCTCRGCALRSGLSLVRHSSSAQGEPSSSS